MKYRSYLLLVSVILGGSLFNELRAQQKAPVSLEPETQRATTQKGRGVVLKKNGRWEYEKVATAAADARDLEKDVRLAFEAWNANDVEKIVRTESLIGGTGFGYRTRAVRLPSPADSDPAAAAASVKGFFAVFDYFRVKLDEVHTAIDGDIGIAWGYYTEDFQPKGGEPQLVRARFSGTWRREGDRWRQLLYHRDAAPFDDRGRYISTKAP